MAIVLCRGKCGCTRIEFVADGVEISDAGNRVKLSSEEWNSLVDKVKGGELKSSRFRYLRLNACNRPTDS